MTQTYAQFDSQLAKAITHFSGTLAELRDIVEKTPKIVDSVSTSMKKDVAEYLGAVKKSQKDSETAILQSTNGLTAQVQQTTESLTVQIQQLDGALNTMLQNLKLQEIAVSDEPEAKR